MISEDFGFNGTVNYTRGKTIIGGSPLSHIPPLFGRVGLVKNLGHWNLESYVLFNGAKDVSLYGLGATDNLNQALDTGTPAWWIWNIELSYSISETLQLQCGVQNILDVHYKPFSSGISAPGRGVFVALNTNF